jgi:hypothetical protein
MFGLMFGCARPRVSPWGDRGAVPIALYAQPADLGARLRAIDDETRPLELARFLEERFVDARGEAYALRGYEGRDTLGRRLVATRVASPHAVVLALGPRPWSDADESSFEPVASVELAGGGALALPVDLTSDGVPDVVLSSPSGRLAIVRVGPRGSALVDVKMGMPPTRFRRLSSGTLALSAVHEWSEATRAGLERTLSFEALSAWDGARMSDRASDVVAHHEQEAARLCVNDEALSSAADAERQILCAWHSLSSGKSESATLDELRKGLAPRLGATNGDRAIDAIARLARSPIAHTDRGAPNDTRRVDPKIDTPRD